jgi:hypothetical protein
MGKVALSLVLVCFGAITVPVTTTAARADDSTCVNFITGPPLLWQHRGPEDDHHPRPCPGPLYCSAPNFVNNGNIKVEDNFLMAGEPLRIGVAQIANGNLHVFKNKGVIPKIVTNNNVTNGDIQCYENDPPFTGGPNTGRAPNQPPFMVPPLTGQNQCSGTSQ